MALRYFRNGPARTLAAPILNATDLAMTVDSASGFPTQYPYTLIIDPDGTLEEAVDVTFAVGNVLTITRGVDSTTASAHAAGVAVVHGVTARDFREANTHVNATTGVHGAAGSLVDTDSVQSIPGQKTFTGGLKTPGGDVLDQTTAQTISGVKTFTSAPVMTNGQTVSGAETHNGTETHNGAVTFAGATTNSSTENHTGTETHSGTETHTGPVTFSNVTVTGNATVNGSVLATDMLRTSNYTLNTDANGFATVSHGAGFTPSMVFAVTSNPSGSFAVFWGADNITSTQVRLRFMNANGGPLVSSAVVGRLFCVRP